jgi:hypothetical protein
MQSKILRDDSGFPIADRLPTLKITMSVPRAPGSLEMKEVLSFANRVCILILILCF